LDSGSRYFHPHLDLPPSRGKKNNEEDYYRVRDDNDRIILKHGTRNPELGTLKMRNTLC